MNPAELIKERDTLRCQLQDAREQAARDSATIARLHARNEELDGLLTAAVFRMELEHEAGSTVLRAWILDARAAIARKQGGSHD